MEQNGAAVSYKAFLPDRKKKSPMCLKIKTYVSDAMMDVEKDYAERRNLPPLDHETFDQQLVMKLHDRYVELNTPRMSHICFGVYIHSCDS